jgi:hypothetical protein
MTAKNLFQFLTDQDNFFCNIGSYFRCVSEVNKQVQYSHKIL